MLNIPLCLYIYFFVYISNYFNRRDHDAKLDNTAMKTKNYLYRTPSHWDGITRFSLKALEKHLHKVGDVQSIKLYIAIAGKYKTTTPRIMVTGTNGKARFGGFLWGYMGEGPRGLVQLLKNAFGYSPEKASHIVQTQPNDYDKIPQNKKFRTVAILVKEA